MALQIEDFSAPEDTVPMSSVPLQFVASVFTSEFLCNDRPQFIAPTRVDGSCIAVPFNTTWHEQIIVQTSSPELRYVMNTKVASNYSLCEGCI